MLTAMAPRSYFRAGATGRRGVARAALETDRDNVARGRQETRYGRTEVPSIERPLSGDVLVFDLEQERERAADPSVLERSGRNARTLLKSGSLRMTLVVIAAGGEIAEHQAEGPITVQPIEGTIRFTVQDRAYDLSPGEMLTAAPGVRHSVTSIEGGAFLLTVAHPGDRP